METEEKLDRRSFLKGEFSSSEGVKIALRDLNSHFVCVLCFGYFVDATTIAECMHTFCKSCIVNFLQTNHHCPHCDTLLSRTRPLSSLRCDRVMQSLVYKTVPGLFQTEMRRRLQFYQSNPHPDSELDVDELQKYVFGPEDFISLSIGYYDARNFPKEKRSELPKEFSPENSKVPIRYFRCPATVPVSVLKSLIKSKYSVSDMLRVELLYGEERLLESWTLMEVAYIFRWPRESPMELTFQILAYRKVRRKRLKLVRKVMKGDSSTNNVSSKDFSKDSSDESNEPPLKMPRLEESTTSFSSSSSTTAEEHHHRPPTPPETPERANDINMDSEHSFPAKTVGFKLAKSPSRKKDNFEITKLIIPNHVPLMEEPNPEVKIQSESEGEDAHIDVESTDSLEKGSSALLNDDYSSAAMQNDMSIDPSLEEEDGETSRLDEDSGDYAGDQDSEAPLEVDTSHETEPEIENELGDFAESDGNAQLKSLHSCGDVEEDEQADGAIDNAETSASDIMDSDEKETDLNLNTESVEMEEHNKKQIPFINEEDTLSRDESSDKPAIEAAKDDSSMDEKAKGKEQSSDIDTMGALDLSSHARSVRAKRENGDSSSNTPSPELDIDKDPAVPDNQSSLTPSTSPKNSLKNMQQLAVPSEAQGIRMQGQAAFTHPSLVPRPSLPIDWTRPGLVGTPGLAPHTTFRDLVTLSHAAVQIQLAMAHAQAQAQAAQAQKMQAQVQANILKNLKATETLSFVNGSGDTLTISPIPGKQGNSKPKNSLKLSKLNKVSSHNQHIVSKSTSNSNNTQTKISIKAPISSVSAPKPIKNQSNGIHIKPNKEMPLINGNSTHTTKSCTPVVSSTTATKASSSKPVQHGSLKTTIPKSALTASLKIPNIHINTSKLNSSKAEKEKKEQDKDKTRTGDPVFKITNQKIIEYVRQQHLNNKLKQNNNTKSSNASDNSNNKSGIASSNTQGNLPKSVATSDSNTAVNTAKANTSNNLSKNPQANSLKTPISNPPNPSNILGKASSSVASSTLKAASHASTLTTPKVNLTSSSVSKPNIPALTTCSSPSVTPAAKVSAPTLPGTAATTKPALASSISSTIQPTSQIKATNSNGLDSSSRPLLNGKSSAAFAPTSMAPKSTGLASDTTPMINNVAVRTTNNSVRQIPNPSRLLQQSENRISAGMGRPMTGGKKIFSSAPGAEGLRIESLTKKLLHEKVAASARMGGGVVNSLAR